MSDPCHDCKDAALAALIADTDAAWSDYQAAISACKLDSDPPQCIINAYAVCIGKINSIWVAYALALALCPCCKESKP